MGEIIPQVRDMAFMDVGTFHLDGHDLWISRSGYTGEDGLIEVVLEKREPHLVLQVRDNGIGIPAADRHRVFERFFRVETSRSEYPGNGLGLVGFVARG